MGEGKDDIRFDRIEGAPPQQACAACQQPLAGSYFHVDGKVTCASCAEAVRAQRGPTGSGAGRFARAVLGGLAGGFVGALVWFAVLKLTGYEVGLVAIVVGLLVGGGVRWGSHRRGGWLYQLLAVGITYCSIVATYVPLAVEAMEGEPDVVLYAAVFVFALAAPFAGGFENVIGILIIGFALWEAWTMNRRVPVTIDGPFAIAPTPAPPPSPAPVSDAPSD
jgi:hypothetical protein